MLIFSQIFEGVVAYIEGVNAGEREKIWKMLVDNGSKIAESLSTPGITHVVTSSWMKENMEHFEVTPSWVTESCKRGMSS